MPEPLLEIRHLQTSFATDAGEVRAVDDLTLTVEAGQTLGIVGESGSGKSVTSLTLMRLLPDEAVVRAARVALVGRDLLGMSQREISSVRGAEMAMIFQEPMTSLNPVLRVGDQVAEAILRHQRVSRAEARAKTVALFREVGIPEPERRVDAYPHELSGGQKQRVMIAMALSCDPKLLIADEPTTALDVTIQAQILELLRTLRDRRGMAMLFITHDLGVIAEIADHVAVMYRGKLVEYGEVTQIFDQPRHPYTRGLLACRPRLDTPYTALPTVDDFMVAMPGPEGVTLVAREMSDARRAALHAPRVRAPSPDTLLTVEGLTVRYPVGRDWFGRVNQWFTAVDDVSFAIRRGETLGLVGESGCGKTTTGRAILRLVEPTAGTVRFDGQDVRALSPAALRALRRRIQIIFQDPYASLNPRMTVEAALTEPMAVHGVGESDADRRRRAAQLLEEVGLDPAYLRRFPHEFSGGQRQRICIARALSLEPDLIVCDESVSALDVSVQAQVLNLLRGLQDRRNLTFLFISHDLSVVKFMSDEMCVMQGGRIVERGAANAVYAAPSKDYTRDLIAAIPRDDLDHIRAIRARRAASAGEIPVAP